MTLKRRISVAVSIVFSLLYAISALSIYWSFANFRREEFIERLEEKAYDTTKLLLEVVEVDNNILDLIDQNSIHRLLNEKILVFDDHYKLIYSSLDDTTINWQIKELSQLKTSGRLYRLEGNREVVGLFYKYQGKDFFTLIAAEDKYGNSKLAFLKQVLLVMYVIGTSLVWISTRFFIRRLLKPLDLFQQQMTHLSLGDTLMAVENQPKSDELTLMMQAFNQMMLRIQQSYNAQREFTSHASHELRTPITRLTLQLDNLQLQNDVPPQVKQYLDSLSRDVNQLSELINSLLILAKMNAEWVQTEGQVERVDELLFDAFDRIKASAPESQMYFSIADNADFSLEVRVMRSLMDIVFTNLIKNALSYAPSPKCWVSLVPLGHRQLEVILSNEAWPQQALDADNLFKPFVRGPHHLTRPGSGLGLHIVKRILDSHQVPIRYAYIDQRHQFTLTFNTL